MLDHGGNWECIGFVEHHHSLGGWRLKWGLISSSRLLYGNLYSWTIFF